MGQRSRILAEVFGFDGWKVKGAFFESADGKRVTVARATDTRGAKLVLVVERRWMARCSQCARACRVRHEQLGARRWVDLPWAGHPVEIEYAPSRIKCRACGNAPIEMVAWADPRQRQSRRLQHHLAVQAASMPVMHVAALHGLSWATVRRAEQRALERWDASRPPRVLRHVGIDEKFLGRRNQLDEKFVTIVSDLETGEPIWIGYGRKVHVLKTWLNSLTPEEKARIQLFAMDMWPAYPAAIRETPGLEHAAIVHDPFHVMKRAVVALDELRKEVFFRAGPELRRLGGGHGRRWLLLRAWERNDKSQQAELRRLFSYNSTLARGYQLKEEFRDVLAAPTVTAMTKGLARILRRTQSHRVKPLRRLHDCIRNHYDAIVALAEHRPATGRIEALNNNWEVLVRRARGYRDHEYLLLKLRFMTAKPIRNERDVQRFVALAAA
ncbi:MAG TPA: ISL3 family transposase [Gemmatimonadaceae bacterium]|nr:ISL3 family transposase [Gemmatimonadaceae bacterium]